MQLTSSLCRAKMRLPTRIAVQMTRALVRLAADAYRVRRLTLNSPLVMIALSEPLKDALDACRRANQLVLVVSAAVFLLAVSPDESNKYEAFGLAADSLAPPHAARADSWLIAVIEEQHRERLGLLADSVRRYLPITDDGGIEFPPYGLMLQGYQWARGLPPSSFELRAPTLADRLTSLTVGEAEEFYTDAAYALPVVPGPWALHMVFQEATVGECLGCEVLTHYVVDTVAWSFRAEWIVMDSAGTDVASIELDTEEYGDATTYERWMLLSMLTTEERERGRVVMASNTDSAVTVARAALSERIERLRELERRYPKLWREYRDTPIHTAGISALARSESEQASVSILGLELNESAAFIGGPILLLAVILFLTVHLAHVASLGTKINNRYAWPPAFEGRSGLLSSVILVWLLPSVAAVVLAVRIGRNYDGNIASSAVASFGALLCVGSVVCSLIALQYSVKATRESNSKA